MSWNYATLQSKVAGFLHRSNLTTEIQDAITLFEGEINARIRHEKMIVSDEPVLAVGLNTIDLPDNYLALVSFRHKQNGYQIEADSVAALDQADTSIVGTPCKYAVDTPNDVIMVSPTADASYTFRRRCFVGVNIAEQDTNWLLNTYPHIYLYGVLDNMLEYITDIDRKNSVAARHGANMAFLEGANWDALPLNDSIQAGPTIG